MLSWEQQMVGYKEWEAVCAALGEGRQCLLLRKGGIHEGRKGFSFKHERFFLFPTRFHAQASLVREAVAAAAEGGEWKTGDEVSLQYFCEAVWARTLSNWELVCQLEPFHIWKEELVRERFDCGEGQQIHCALVRVRLLPQPWTVRYEKKYGGCRTWVELPEPPAGWERELIAAIPDEEFAERREVIERLTGGQ